MRGNNKSENQRKTAAKNRRMCEPALITIGFDAKKAVELSRSDREKIDAYIKEKGVTRIPQKTVEDWLKPDPVIPGGMRNKKFNFRMV